jgi:hypothetical protein
MLPKFITYICLKSVNKLAFKLNAVDTPQSRVGIRGHQFNQDSSLLLNAIHSPFYWRILKKTLLFSGFKNPYKNLRNKKTRGCILELHFVEWKNEGKKPDKISSLRRLKFMPRNLDKKCYSRIPFQVRKAVFLCRGAQTAVLL